MIKILNYFLGAERTLFRSVQQWLVLVCLLGTATICAYLLNPYVSITSQAMVYVLAVVISSYIFDWLKSVICAFAAVMCLNFFFVPPRWTFQVERSEHFIALMTMLVVALVINRLANGLRRETEVAHLNERRARQLRDLAIALADAYTAQEALALGQHTLDVEFTGPCLAVLVAPDGGDAELASYAHLSKSIKDGLICCMKEARVLGPGTERWPGLDAWYLPLGEKGQIVGAVCIPSVSADDDNGREHARALCTILAQGLWRMRLTTSMLLAEGEAQRQQLQSIFLAAISHDLRTPLAVVVGAATSLQIQRDKLDLAEQERLLASIVGEANYLTTVTENTLQLVRLSSTSSSGKLIGHEWESIEEIVGAVLARVRQRDPGRRIISNVPNGLPLVKVDPVLISQLIGNLLDNALKYSDDKIDLTVALVMQGADQRLELSVKDRGIGIPEAQKLSIFEPYSRMDHNDKSTQRGAGLGLAVCRAIAEAHCGRLVLQQRAGGGSSFTLSLLVDDVQPQTMIEV